MNIVEMEIRMRVSQIPVFQQRPILKEPWLVRHWQQVLLAFAAASLAGILASLVVANLGKAEERGWEQLSYVMSQMSQGQKPEALKTLDTLLSSQRSGPVAVNGFLLRSDILLSEGKKDEALAASREALRQAASPEYKALASASVCYVLEEDGKTSEAADAYGRFIKDFPDHFLTPRACAQQGRLLFSLGRLAEAKEVLEKLITLYPSTIWAGDAKAALEGMKGSPLQKSTATKGAN